MEIIVEIPEYTGEGLRSEWEYGFEIETKINDGEFLISANKAGLISLAKQLLTLAQDSVPSNYHLHFDEYNSLEEGSVELIIQKV
ncbi:hypothetical protein QF042_004544 [Pedobacter sp. W3I1]|uniref:Imm32 family immunity protein n=1 Tax=Pedobacter sp. W3I1 TaxID=3042291 RepID=UPI002784749A|nr:hypothetical protein [Pedobacter sp. W3I1]MDQ0640979.1 hypothetical protein [Pedobacter sp. W3I1]